MGQKLRATKQFNGNNGGPDYLSFQENDIIEVVSVDTGNANWWMVSARALLESPRFLYYDKIHQCLC